MSEPKLGIVGLALPHPYTFTQILNQHGFRVSFIWDYEEKRALEFSRNHGAKVVSKPEDMIAAGVEGVFIFTMSGEHAKYSVSFLEARVPLFIDKPMTTNLKDLQTITDVAHKHRSLLMSSSVLRYAPVFQELQRRVKSGILGTFLAGSAIVAHGIEGYLHGPNTWQDNIEMGGGSIINMGIYGLEPLYMMLGPGVESVYCDADKRHHTSSQSEDTAIITVRFANGALGVVQVLCGIQAHGYFLTVHGSEASIETGVPSPTFRNFAGLGPKIFDMRREFGFTGTVLQFLKMIETKEMAVPLEQTAEIVKTLIAARISVKEKRAIYLKDL